MKRWFLPLVVLCLLPASARAQDWLYEDAQILALEWTGELDPDLAVVQEIMMHVTQCRIAEPAVAGIRVFPDWVPGSVLVKMMPNAYADFVAGDPTDMVELGDSLGAIVYDDLGLTIVPRLVVIEFDRPLHPLRLEELFEALTSIEYADANGIAGDGNDITRVAPDRYLFREAWGDCPAGCIYENTWLFEIGDTGAVVVSRNGSPATGTPTASRVLEVSSPRPNPFNPSTTVELRLTRPAQVRAELFDVAGRRVATLLDAALGAGTRNLHWDGTDSRGGRVASGTYLLRVDAGGEAAVRRLTLVE